MEMCFLKIPHEQQCYIRYTNTSRRRVLGFSCILDTFYDNLKATDLVYFISWMKTLRGYMHHPQFLLSVQRIAKLFRKKRVGQAGFSQIMIFYISVN